MVGCCIDRCSYKSGHKNSGNIKLFRFPVDENLQELWMKALQCFGLEFNARLRICSQHFESEDIVAGLRLKKNAIPSVFPDLIKEIVVDKQQTNNAVFSSMKEKEKSIKLKKKMKKEELEAMIAITMFL